MADNQQLRVIHINTAKTWRGGERQTFNLAVGLKRRGVEQLLIVKRGGELEKRCRQANLATEGLPLGNEIDPISIWGIARAIRSFKATHIHSHTGRAHSLAILAKLFSPGVKLVVSRRVDFTARNNIMASLKYRNRIIDRFIAISENVKAVLLRDGVSPERIAVVYSGINFDDYNTVPEPDYLREEFKLKTGEVIIGNVAALVDHKDQRTLLRAMARLEQLFESGQGGATPPYRLLIIGAGELEDELKRLASELGLLDRGVVIFTGYRTDVLPFYRLFDLFVMSSKEEGLGTAVLDAMYFGLPVVGTAAGGIPEMVDNEQGGLLAPAGDPDTLAEKLFALIKSSDLRRSYGEYNRQRVKNFSAEALADETLAVYRELL